MNALSAPGGGDAAPVGIQVKLKGEADGEVQVDHEGHVGISTEPPPELREIDGAGAPCETRTRFREVQIARHKAADARAAAQAQTVDTVLAAVSSEQQAPPAACLLDRAYAGSYHGPGDEGPHAT